MFTTISLLLFSLSTYNTEIMRVFTTNNFNKKWPSVCFRDLITYFCIVRYTAVSIHKIRGRNIIHMYSILSKQHFNFENNRKSGNTTTGLLLILIQDVINVNVF